LQQRGATSQRQIDVLIDFEALVVGLFPEKSRPTPTADSAFTDRSVDR
jgi:hypothetical protein